MKQLQLQWKLDIVDFEIREIFVIVDKEMLPISISLGQIPWYSGILWNSGIADDERVHYIKVSLNFVVFDWYVVKNISELIRNQPF